MFLVKHRMHISYLTLFKLIDISSELRWFRFLMTRVDDALPYQFVVAA